MKETVELILLICFIYSLSFVCWFFFFCSKIVLYDLIYREMSIEKYKVVVNNVGSCECDLIQLVEFETRLQ